MAVINPCPELLVVEVRSLIESVLLYGIMYQAIEEDMLISYCGVA